MYNFRKKGLTVLHYDAELNFCLRLLKEFQLPYNLLRDDSENLPGIDLGIRKLLQPDFDESKNLKRFLSEVNNNTVYKVNDEFFCSYIFLRLPGTQAGTVLAIGPYTEIELSHSQILKTAKKSGIDPGWLPSLEMYYSSVLYIPDDQLLRTVLQVLGEEIWGINNFKHKTLEKGTLKDYDSLFSPFISDSKNNYDFNVKIIETRYINENRLIEAVQQGRTHQVETMLSGFTPASVEHRAAEPTRNAKNYLIILNTLMRKAVEQSGVHPLHIDRLSSEIARKIENITSWSQIQPLCKKMADKYCGLVNSHSVKGYSSLIQKVIALIDFDLTADLSLKTTAQTIGVNSSYLSSLFKKETGQTLTDFVNTKRVEHAKFLLVSTDLPVSVIGQHCGIPDNNYFTKIFKKHTDKTPKEYRSISGEGRQN